MGYVIYDYCLIPPAAHPLQIRRLASRIRLRFPLWCGRVSELLMSSRSLFCRAVLIGGLLALGLSACGRRGALEPPPNPSAAQAQAQQGTASEGSGQATLPSPVGT